MEYSSISRNKNGFTSLLDMFFNIKVLNITTEEMNKHLEYVKDCRRVHYRPYIRGVDVFSINNAYLDVGIVHVKLWYKADTGRIYEYIARLDGLVKENVSNGLDAFKTMSQYYKIPRPELISDSIPSASPYLYYNEKYEGQKLYAYGYDMNSAYSYAMLQDMPDTSKEYHSGIVTDKEIGFDLDLNLVEVGQYAEYIFPSMPSPFTKFVKVWYNKKEKGKNNKDRENAKAVLNYSVGYLQRVNPFLRAIIVNRCNKLIKSLQDENTILCNTDSIVTLKSRDDLILGTDIGQWKIEHQGDFAYTGYNYQWYHDQIAYRHIPTAWFDKGWDILEDELPDDSSNKYYFDFYDLKIIKKVATSRA